MSDKQYKKIADTLMGNQSRSLDSESLKTYSADKMRLGEEIEGDDADKWRVD
jgi:hypothetical protein